ncbi:hypothetical protein [Sphingobacterium detergens]
MIIGEFEENGKIVQIDLSPLAYTGGQNYRIMFDNYFITDISFTNRGWLVHFNNTSWMGSEERDIIIELIEGGQITR